MGNFGIVFQIVALLIIASPVAASSVEGELKPLKILTLGKQSQDCYFIPQTVMLTCLKTEEVCKVWQRC
jgi:hypothetical protein